MLTRFPGLGGGNDLYSAIHRTQRQERKEIYEGDILEYDFLPEGKDQRSKIVFSNGCFCIKDGKQLHASGEVIGNIHENPNY